MGVSLNQRQTIEGVSLSWIFASGPAAVDGVREGTCANNARGWRGGENCVTRAA